MKNRLSLFLFFTMLLVVPLASASPFMTEWVSSYDLSGQGGSNSTTIVLPITGAFTVDWGDGITNSNISTHTWEGAGVKTISITNDGENCFSFALAPDDRLKLSNIVQWGDVNLGACGYNFQGASNARIMASDSPNLEGVNLSGAFAGMNVYHTGDGNTTFWNMTGVTDTSYMFAGTALAGDDPRAWDTSTVTSMAHMFDSVSGFNANLSAWNTSSVTDFSYMFNGDDAFNSDLSTWDTSKATNMADMFSGASSFDSDLSAWNTSSAADLTAMFQDASAFNSDLSSWDVSQVTSLYDTFSNAASFNGNVSTWNTSRVTSFHRLFYEACAFSGDVSAWDVSQVTDFESAFECDAGNSLFDSDLSAWDTSSATDFSYMFECDGGNCAFNQPIGSWNTSLVTDMQYMFFGSSAFNQDLSGWDVSWVTDLSYFLSGNNLSEANYDALLNSWAGQDVQSGVTFDAGNSIYTAAAIASRDYLVNTMNWTITDGGLAGGSPTPTPAPLPNAPFSIEGFYLQHLDLLAILLIGIVAVLGYWIAGIAK